MNRTQNAVAALFRADDDAIGEAIAELVNTGVLPGSLSVITRSERRARELHESYSVRAIDAFEKPRNAITDFIGLRDEPKSDGRDVFDRLNDLGIDEDRARHFAASLGDDVLLVLPGRDVTAERVTILVRARGDLGLANGAGVERTILLRAEILEVQKNVVVTNEIVFTTEVIKETKTFDVQVTREEFVIRRTRLAEGGGVEIVRIPLRHEEVELTKRTVVREEVDVHTEQIVEIERVEAVVRHEVLSIDSTDLAGA